MDIASPSNCVDIVRAFTEVVRDIKEPERKRNMRDGIIFELIKP